MQFQLTSILLSLLLATTTIALPTASSSSSTPATANTTCVTNTSSGSVSGSVACISTFNTCMQAAAGDAGQITACSLSLASCETATNTNTKPKRTLHELGLGLAHFKNTLEGARSKSADSDTATTATKTDTAAALSCADHHGGAAVGSVSCVGQFLGCLDAASGNAGTITACSLGLSACEVGVNTRRM